MLSLLRPRASRSAIVYLTRDILSILVTNAVVERLFHTTCDLCHYR